MSAPSVASRYARALYEASRERGKLAEASVDMKSISVILERVPGVKEYCMKRHTDRQAETEFVNAAFTPYVGAFAGEMLLAAVRNGRLDALPFIPGAYERIAAGAEGIVPVLLETAREPDEELIRTVIGKMRKRTGREIRLRTKIVAELLGGFRISWENRMIDSSALGRLRALRSRLEEDDGGRTGE